MNITRLVGALALALVSAGCSTVETVSRATPFGVGPEVATAGADETATVMRGYDVTDVRVTVPASLSVSEANSYLPRADIVWRGDPAGDRRAQISEVIRTAFEQGSAGLSGPRPVIVDLEIARWHSVTERTRYTVGGVHSLKFTITVRDAETGAVIEAPRLIETRLPAYGGQAAIDAEARGETQKVRLIAHLEQVARRELTGSV